MTRQDGGVRSLEVLNGQRELPSEEDPYGGVTVAKLVYIANTSLDGYTEDPDGGIDFGPPDEEYFALINGLQRPVGTYLYGRRMYEAMIYWESASIADQPSWIVDFTNMWRAADKIVFSRTLGSVSSQRTTLEEEFNVEAIRQMKAEATRDVTVGGADLAAQAMGAGLVDECHLFFWPIVLGGGKHALPRQTRFDFALLNEQCTRGGVIHLHYRVTQ
jgi:dihydrofolate reductase